MEDSSLRPWAPAALRSVLSIYSICRRGRGSSGPSGGSTLVSKYAYGNDGLARRTYAIRSGLAFAATHQDAWGYNDRNELTTTRRYNDPNVGGTTNADPNLNRDYQYDAIGNRTSSAEGTGGAWTYARNSVNQYPAVDTPELGARYLFDSDGNLSELLASADINLDGNIDQDDVDMVLFCYGLNVDDPNCGMSPEERQRADISGNGTIDQDDLDAVLFYFGATVSDTLNALLAWDGENRLVQWTPRSPKNGSKKCEFKYDYMGRRVEKKVYTYSGSAWSLTTTRRFVWREWLLLLELDGSGNVLKKYTRGRDLSGSLEGAGGIGGLLSVQDANGTPSDPNDDFKYVYFYDVNGNVGQVVDLAVGDPNNTIKAQYVYDAFGNVTYSAGAYASTNVIRFSTKPWDDETGMGDWGRRYYDPRLGRGIGCEPAIRRINEPFGDSATELVGILNTSAQPLGSWREPSRLAIACWLIRECRSGLAQACRDPSGEFRYCYCPADGEQCPEDMLPDCRKGFDKCNDNCDTGAGGCSDAAYQLCRAECSNSPPPRRPQCIDDCYNNLWKTDCLKQKDACQRKCQSLLDDCQRSGGTWKGKEYKWDPPGRPEL